MTTTPIEREAEIIARTPGGPVTVDSLCADFAALGIAGGMTLLVHSSLSQLGWVCGGPVAVILALEAVLTERGTLVMPAHSGELSDPAEWVNPPVPSSWWGAIRAAMPAFRPDLTPTRGMGVIPETFRRQEGVLRSGHPQVSFAAWGRHAEEVVRDHSLAFPLGEKSPLARIYALDGWILLLGVDHDSNTSLHLAENRANWPGKQVIRRGAPCSVGGKREWLTFEDIEDDTDDFVELGQAYETQEVRLRTGKIAGASARLMPQRALVDFGVSWMSANRPHLAAGADPEFHGGGPRSTI
jgi:aminoglycoside 3-N-acetyltransferase